LKEVMKHIALSLELNDYFDRGIARGVIQYAKEVGNWTLHGHGWMFSNFTTIPSWRGDGIITRIEFLKDLNQFLSLPYPVVDIANAFADPKILRVTNDDYISGKLAGITMRNNQVRSFAYCGVSECSWSLDRLRGFLDTIGQPAIPTFMRPLKWWIESFQPKLLEQFVSNLPAMTGVFCSNDKTGLRLTNVCKRIGREIPNTLSIIGVDNDDIPCELSNPRLSSVELNLTSIGYQAAKLLDTQIDNPSSSKSQLLIPPLRVIERDSTLYYTEKNDVIGKLYQLLREPGGQFLSIVQLADKVGVSRRALEIIAHKKQLGSLHRLIIQEKIRRALQLLSDTNLKMEFIAQESGFGSPQRFYKHFKEHLGTSPSKMRSKLTNQIEHL
jgi:LacI family transcriptional regulator